MAGTDRCHAHILPILFLTSAVVTSPTPPLCGNPSVDRPVGQRELAGLNLRQFQHGIDDFEQMLACRLDLVDFVD